jgi:hypothetical protein
LGSDVVVIEGGAVTLTVMEAVLDASETRVAVTVTLVSGPAGAVYVAEVDVWLLRVPAVGVDHVTPCALFVVAVMVMLCPSSIAGVADPIAERVNVGLELPQLANITAAKRTKQTDTLRAARFMDSPMRGALVRYHSRITAALTPLTHGTVMQWGNWAVWLGS